MGETATEILFLEVYQTFNMSLHTNIPPRVRVKFTIRPFSDEWMAFCESTDYTPKESIRVAPFFGNSLHGVGSLDKESLLKKIKSYVGLDQIKKDFSC